MAEAHKRLSTLMPQYNLSPCIFVLPIRIDTLRQFFVSECAIQTIKSYYGDSAHIIVVFDAKSAVKTIDPQTLTVDNSDNVGLLDVRQVIEGLATTFIDVDGLAFYQAVSTAISHIIDTPSIPGVTVVVQHSDTIIDPKALAHACQYVVTNGVCVPHNCECCACEQHVTTVLNRHSYSLEILERVDQDVTETHGITSKCSPGIPIVISRDRLEQYCMPTFDPDSVFQAATDNNDIPGAVEERPYWTLK